MTDTSTARPLLLGSYVAKRCARRVHNDFEPALTAPEEDEDEVLPRIVLAGIEHETVVMQAFLDELGASCADLRRLDRSAGRPYDKTAHITATLEAMNAGKPVILGGRLPDDLAGGRISKPDVLLRGDDRPDGRAGYVPVDVKGHRATQHRKRGQVSWSTVGNPFLGERHTTEGLAPGFRTDDALQLAHYQRHLEALHWDAPGPRLAAVVGTDLIDEVFPVLVWHDLDEQVFKTFSRSRGEAFRSAMDRYDHEFSFRLDVARVAQQQIGSPGDPAALVLPIATDECDACPWHDTCADILGPDDSSAAITTRRPSVREWHALRQLGIQGVADLAGLDLAGLEDKDAPLDERTSALLARYLAEVSHLRPGDVRGRLGAAVRRARMIQAGHTLTRTTTGALPVPRADIEIDFDLEWDEATRCYLWGFLVDDRNSEPTYTCFVDWEPLDAEGERRLAVEALNWLASIRAAAEADNRSVLVYHYSSAEVTRLRRIVSESECPGLPDFDQLEELIDDTFVDLFHDIVAQHYFGLHGLGLKAVANSLGFGWRDDDPGGLQSQDWLVEARTDTAARKRLLAYNEDDVRATWHLRAALTQED